MSSAELNFQAACGTCALACTRFIAAAHDRICGAQSSRVWARTPPTIMFVFQQSTAGWDAATRPTLDTVNSAQCRSM